MFSSRQKTPQDSCKELSWFKEEKALRGEASVQRPHRGSIEIECNHQLGPALVRGGGRYVSTCPIPCEFTCASAVCV